MKKIAKIIIGVMIVIVLIIGTITMQYFNSIKAVSKESEPVTFTIEQGMGHQDVLKALDQQDLINSPFFAKLFLKFNQYPIIQANTYELNKNMDLKTIFEIISSGSYDYVVKEGFTITEGSTIPQVAKVIGDKLGITEQEVLDKWSGVNYLNQLISKYDFLTSEILNRNILYPLEGYLYPETYNVTGIEPTIENYTELMLNMTQDILTPYLSRIEASNMTVHQFLTFVSVVERESLFDEDKPMIAGVFKNRLAIDMYLQSDITVLYALQETKEIVTYKDLEVESLYNTYKYPGLPVGPISNVYKSTIEACLNPTEHDYYYFFADRNGKVYYSKTLAEHEKIAKEYAW